MSENLRKLIGVAVMAAIVVVGVVATSGDDSDFTRSGVFAKLDGVKPQMPEPQGLYDTASPAYIAHFQEVLPAGGGDDSWFLHNDRYSTLDLICCCIIPELTSDWI